MRVSEIRVKQIRFNQGLGVLGIYNFGESTSQLGMIDDCRSLLERIHHAKLPSILWDGGLQFLPF